MSMTEAIRAYRALDTRQRQLLRAKRLDGDFPPADWLALLRPLARFDRHGDRLRQLAGKIAIGTGVLLFISFFLIPFLAELPVLNLLVVLPPLSLFLFLASLSVWLYLRRLDLSNQLREFLLPLIALLEDDIKTGHTLRLALDLRGGTRKDKRTGGVPAYSRGAYRRIVETHYEDPWLHGETVLTDGGQLTLDLVDHIRELKKTKRTARGKTKTKTKYKVRGETRMQLRLPTARYFARPLPDAPAEGLQEAIRPGEKWLTLRARRITPRPVLAMLTRLYRSVELRSAPGANHA
jgi:hypothetical protein